MNGFVIHTGNRLEELAGRLAGELARPAAGGGLRPEVAVVPGQGAERWLKLFLARETGIAANLECPFPQTFIEQRVFNPLRTRLDSRFAEAPFTGEVLSWKIFFRLASEDDLADLPEVAGYLEAAGDELSRYHLARDLGELFLRYLAARPELIRAWDRGYNPLAGVPAADWQMVLWRRLAAAEKNCHFADLHELLNQLVYPEIYRGETAPQLSGPLLGELSRQLPPRLFLFAFSSLPLVYLDIFFALARLIEVHLFYLNPCADYWGDQYRPGIVQPGMRAPQEGGFHPLLAAWGRQGRAFFEAVATLEVDRYEEHFKAPDGFGLLSILQRSLLTLAEPAPEKVLLAEGDHSLEIHRCHTRRREIEVLRDVILQALDDDPELEPDGIVVLAPDIELYRPYIEAVFRPVGGGPGAAEELPVNLVSAAPALRLPVIGALLELLRLLPGRLPAAEVFDLFSREVVCRRFGVEPAELGKLSSWLKQAGVSWGLDADHRKETAGVAFAEHSFAWGLERLLAGYGLAGNGLRDEERNPFAGLGEELPVAGLEDFLPSPYPLPGIEGSDALVLGGFCTFVAALEKARRQLAEPLPAAAWKGRLEDLRESFIQPENPADPGLELLERRLAGLAADLEKAVSGDRAATPQLGLETVRAALEERLAHHGGRAGFFAGGISFASLLELRGLPASMICVLGLNDGEFPRSDRPPAYDLIAARPRPGDRTARDEDRFIFLETLLAARGRLVLSYLGRDPADNRLRPASPLLVDLLEYLEERFLPPPAAGREKLADYLVYDHPPQPFSRRYFAAEQLYSYSAGQREIAVRLARDGFTFSSFRRAGLEPETVETVGLEELVSFFRSPAEWFCRKRLRLLAELDDFASFPESEPFALDSLAAYQLSRQLVDALLAAGPGESEREEFVEALYHRLAACGRLPLGARGRELLRKHLGWARELAARLRPLRAEPLPVACGRISLPVGRGRSVELDFRLDNLFRGEDGVVRQVFFRPIGKPGPRDRVKSVIHHLVCEATVVTAAGFPVAETLFLGRDSGKGGRLSLEVAANEEVVGGRSGLGRLGEFFLAGSTRALPFLPELSLEWFAKWHRLEERGAALDPIENARDLVLSWLDSDYHAASRADYFRNCFAAEFDSDDFWRDFVELALELGPVFRLQRQ